MAHVFTRNQQLLFLFELKQCIEHVFYKLNQYTIRTMLVRNSNILLFLKQNCITNKRCCKHFVQNL